MKKITKKVGTELAVSNIRKSLTNIKKQEIKQKEVVIKAIESVRADFEKAATKMREARETRDYKISEIEKLENQKVSNKNEPIKEQIDINIILIDKI